MKRSRLPAARRPPHRSSAIVRFKINRRRHRMFWCDRAAKLQIADVALMFPVNMTRNDMTGSIEALETRTLLAFAPIQTGAKGYDVGSETVIDADGNTIVAGIFAHTVDFGAKADGSTGHFKLTAVGETDVFISKYNPAGQLLWAGQIGGEESKLPKKPNYPIDPERNGSFFNRVGVQLQTLGEYVNALAVDASGNIYMGGTFLKTADLDPTKG